MPKQNGISEDLKNLLSEWKLECILSHLIVEKIDIEILEMMKVPHIRLLLHNFPLGIQIRFEHCLEQWRKNLGKPFQIPANENIIQFINAEREFKTKITEKEMQNRDTQTDLLNNNFDSIAPTDEQTCKDITPKHSSATENLLVRVKAADLLSADMSGALRSQRPTTQQIDLKEILSNSTCGLGLMNNYRLRKRLSNSERKLLIATIVNYYLVNSLDFNVQISYALERAILKMFPSEKLGFYRTTRRGRLYVRYISAKSAVKQEGDIFNEGGKYMADIEESFALFSDDSHQTNEDQYPAAAEISDLTHFDGPDNDDEVRVINESIEDCMENSTEIKIEPENIHESPPFTPTSTNSNSCYKKRKDIEEIEKPFEDFVIPWLKIPCEVVVLMENKEMLGKRLNVFANLIVDELRKISVHIPICVFRAVTQQALAKYPHSFLEKDSMGNLIASPKLPLLSRMRYRNCNLNRNNVYINRADTNIHTYKKCNCIDLQK